MHGSTIFYLEEAKAQQGHHGGGVDDTLAFMTIYYFQDKQYSTLNPIYTMIPY